MWIRSLVIPLKKGGLTHNICPVHSLRKSLSNEGSQMNFQFHVEFAAFDFRPDFLSLLCLIQDGEKMATTHFAEISHVCLLLRIQDQALLLQPL